MSCNEGSRDRVCEFKCNIDDMTAEEIAFAAEMLMGAGAKDVNTDPVVMKKGRPGMIMTVMCEDSEEEKKRMIELIFRYTSTIGIREIISDRYILDRTIDVIDTPYGKVRRKTVSGYGVSRSKYEYEDLARIAKEKGISISDARELIESII